MLTKCPICDGKIHVSEITCEKCDAKISKKFEINDKVKIDEDIMEFIKVFIFAEGNIKKVEAILNCSYPKVKNLLKKAQKSLKVEKKEEQNKEQILAELSDGNITFDEAMEKLEKL